MHALVITAVDAERDAVAAAAPPGTTVVAGGVGPAASAAATALALSREPFDLVLCAGIGGGFAPLGVGDVAVASSVAFADLGAEDGDDFLPLTDLGFGTDRYEVGPKLAIELADRTGGHLGTVLTVATVTGSVRTAAALLARFPDAVAEGMEGAGVAAAAQMCGVPFGELRAISNAVGPRDRSSWRIPDALVALGRAVASAVQ